MGTIGGLFMDSGIGDALAVNTMPKLVNIIFFLIYAL